MTELLVLPRERVYGACPYIAECPDTIALRQSEEIRLVDDNLADQHYELCSKGGRCSLRQNFERNRGGR